MATKRRDLDTDTDAKDDGEVPYDPATAHPGDAGWGQGERSAQWAADHPGETNVQRNDPAHPER